MHEKTSNRDPGVQPTNAFADMLRNVGGETGHLIADFDWATTSIGPMANWSQSLRTMMGYLLRSPLPHVMLWNEDGVMLYNDAYSVFAGGRHPTLLGSKVREGWPEVADFNDNVMRVGLAGGTLAYVDQELTLYRHGTPEQVWMNLDYSPVPDENGKPVGVMAVVIETTDRVLAERHTNEERHRQEVMLQQMPGFAAILHGPNHIFTYANDAYHRISGPRDFVGHTVREVFPELASQGFYELLDEVYVSGKPFVARAVPIRLAGESEARYIDLLYQPIKDANDKVGGIFVGGYDVTDAERQSKALRDFNADLERQVIERTQARGTIWQVTPDLLGALNSEGYFETSNPAWQTVLGWSEAEVASMSIFEMLHPDDVERTRGGFELTQIGQPAIRFPNRYRCKNGTYRWISWVGILEGKFVYCTGRDVTEDYAQAEALARTTAERDLFATVFESTDSFIHIIDLDYRWLAINPAGAAEFAKAFGPYPKAGDRLLDLLDDAPAERAAAEAIWSRALAGEEFTAINEFGSPGHERNAYEMKFNRLFDKNGNRIGAYQVVTNISERVQAADRLAEAEEQLRQAQKMEAVGQLTGGIAHDFNNMLAVVMGSLDLLNRRVGVEDPRSKRQIESAADAAKRAANLTQRLLAFSRQQPLQPETVEANKLVSNMSDLLHHSIGADIRLETVLAAGVWPVHVDPNQLENVILNLAVNARDAMSGGGRLTIETQNVHLDARYVLKEPGISSGHYVMLAISDTGSGMAPEVVAKAFDPFFTTKAVGKGTGLGLSQVYGFVKQSGGHVRIYSELGQGTTVKIYLPRGKEAAGSTLATNDVFPTVHGDSRELVLIVDDEPAVRQFSADAFRELGYSVIEAESAATALQLIGSRREIALLFTDIIMPDINGRQLVEAAHIIRPGLKVLYTTGFTRNAVMHNGVLDPGVELIGKPFTLDELAVRVRELLDR